MTPGQIGIVVSANVLVIAVLQTPFGRLADRWDRLKLLLAGSGVSAVMMAFLPESHGFAQMFFICLLIGAAAALSMPAALAMIVEEGRRYGQGSATGFFNLGMSLGLGVGPILAGQVVDLMGLNHAFHLAALVGLGGALVVGRLAVVTGDEITS